MSFFKYFLIALGLSSYSLGIVFLRSEICIKLVLTCQLFLSSITSSVVHKAILSFSHTDILELNSFVRLLVFWHRVSLCHPTVR